MSRLSTEVPAFVLEPGDQPLLISMPHIGTQLPPALVPRLCAQARQLADTDWHLARLYAFARELGATLLMATHSRYVIDLNRPPDGASLYPGQSVTGLCPVDSFDQQPLYLPGQQPGPAEIEARRQALWQPYHQQLAAELERLRAHHGAVVLWDAHSIRSHVPRFFPGRLPDFNLGTAQGQSCAPELAQRVEAIAQAAAGEGYSAVLNGRFTGGYITRHYGQPQRQVHAIQMEMTQCSYMQEALPFDYLPAPAARVQVHLRRMVEAALDFAQRQCAARSARTELP
jgi:N-formylglutamate deformylase